MTTLFEKEQQLQDRKNKLESSIQELKENILSEDIEKASSIVQAKSQELAGLKAQLELTQLAHAQAQEKLRARKEYEASKEYKDKQKMQEKLTGEARKQTMSIYDSASELLNDIQEVKEKVQQADSIFMELAEDKASAQRHVQVRQLPFSLLWSLERELKVKLADMERRKEKGLV